MTIKKQLKAVTDEADDAATRIRIAAIRIFNERGYGSASMEDIARVAGVGIGTIYRRWLDKPALANDVYAWVERSLMDATTATVLEADSNKARFLELWARTWHFASSHADRYVFAEGHTHEAFLDVENRRNRRRYFEATGQLLAGLGVSASSELAVSMIVGTVVHLLRSRGNINPVDAGERLWRALH